MGVWRITKWLGAAVAGAVIGSIVTITVKATGLEDAGILLLQGKGASAMPEWLGLLFTPSVFVLGMVAGATIESRVRARQKNLADRWEALALEVHRIWDRLDVQIDEGRADIRADLLGDIIALEGSLQRAGVDFSAPGGLAGIDLVRALHTKLGLIKASVRSGQAARANELLKV